MHKIDAAGRLVACNTILYEGDEFFGQVIAALHARQQLHYGLDLFAHIWIGDSYALRPRSQDEARERFRSLEDGC